MSLESVHKKKKSVEICKNSSNLHRNHRNLHRNHRNLLGFGRIWLNLTRYGRDLLESKLDLVEVGQISYITLVELGGLSFGEENPSLDLPTSVLGRENLPPINWSIVLG